MLIVYIKTMDTQISTDALTGLNNRGQLMRYVSIKSNLSPEDRLTFLVMFDVNNFKTINDTYGHAEGDRALVLVAEALRSAVKGREVPGFLGRYGGDEFVIIAHPVHKEEMDLLLEDIRSRIEAAAKNNALPYRLTVGAGCDEFQQGGQDTFQKCLQRADKKLYLDKEYRKLHEAAEAAES
ncbi:MAG: GGDEF domain-containing protein, partial [Clostridia bacterium]|nr:GGDEF domain-containing protein [Clostridia bacterium]